MVRTKIFLPPVPKSQDDVLPWSAKITHVLDELNLRAERAARESQTTTTRYIDLPISEMFVYPDSATARLSITSGGALGIVGTTGTIPPANLFGWVSTTWDAVGAPVQSQWCSYFRLPSDYVVGTNLTFYVSGCCGQIDAAVHTFDLSTRRNGPSEAGTQGFGRWTDWPTQAVWADNTDLVTTNIQNVQRYVSGSNYMLPQYATQLSFTINGNDADYPLAANNLIQSSYTAVVQKVGGAAANQFFSNFYISYTGRG